MNILSPTQVLSMKNTQGKPGKYNSNLNFKAYMMKTELENDIAGWRDFLELEGWTLVRASLIIGHHMSYGCAKWPNNYRIVQLPKEVHFFKINVLKKRNNVK